MSELLVITHPAKGSLGGAFWVGNENVLIQHENNAQLVEDRVELSIGSLFGNGVLAGSYAAPLLSIGAGLTVAVAPHISIIGFALQLANASTIVVPANQAAVYLWEYQDNSDTASHYTYTLVNVNPSTDPENPAIAIGTCVTGAATVTSVNDTARTEVVPPAKGMIEESFTQATGAVNFDGAADRTLGAGPHNTVTVSHPINAMALMNVYIERENLVPADDWTVVRSTGVITFLAGAAPQNGEKVRVQYVPQ